MSALLFSPVTPRSPLAMLRRRPLPSIVDPASVQLASAPCRAGASGGSTSYAAARTSLPRLAAAATESPEPGPSDSTPPSAEEEAEHAKLAQVSKKLEKTARYFKTLGSLGFWSQLVCTTVSAGILSFSAVATGKATSSFTYFATAVGIVAAFVSVFRSHGYIRLSERLKRTANDPSKAPPRSDVVKYLRNNIWINVLNGRCSSWYASNRGCFGSKSSYHLRCSLLPGNTPWPESCACFRYFSCSGFSQHDPLAFPWDIFLTRTTAVCVVASSRFCPSS